MEIINKQELYITLNGFKKFCKLLKIRPSKEEIEKIKKKEGLLNEKESNNIIN